LSKDNKPQQQVTTPKHSILKDKKANSKEDAISLVNETPISNHKVDKKYPPQTPDLSLDQKSPTQKRSNNQKSSTRLLPEAPQVPLKQLISETLASFA
jgi:hypothetical protein